MVSLVVPVSMVGLSLLVVLVVVPVAVLGLVSVRRDLVVVVVSARMVRSLLVVLALVDSV